MLTADAHSAGLIDEDEYNRMMDLYAKRTAVAHGFAAGRVTQAEVKRVCGFARQLA